MRATSAGTALGIVSATARNMRASDSPASTPRSPSVPTRCRWCSQDVHRRGDLTAGRRRPLGRRGPVAPTSPSFDGGCRYRLSGTVGTARPSGGWWGDEGTTLVRDDAIGRATAAGTPATPLGESHNNAVRRRTRSVPERTRGRTTVPAGGADCEHLRPVEGAPHDATGTAGETTVRAVRATLWLPAARPAVALGDHPRRLRTRAARVNPTADRAALTGDPKAERSRRTWWAPISIGRTGRAEGRRAASSPQRGYARPAHRPSPFPRSVRPPVTTATGAVPTELAALDRRCAPIPAGALAGRSDCRAR